MNELLEVVFANISEEVKNPVTAYRAMTCRYGRSGNFEKMLSIEGDTVNFVLLAPVIEFNSIRQIKSDIMCL